MDPGTKLGIFLGGAGLLATAIWLAARKLFGPAPKRDSTTSNNPEGGLPPGSD